MAQRKDISIQFIAEQCGVSTATVSRVLNNDKRVAEKTREKILAAFETYHYIVPAAPTPANPRIGIITTIETSDYYTALVVRLREWLRKAGLRAIVISTDLDENELPPSLDTLYECGVSGVFLISCPYLSLRDKMDLSVPHVWIDCNDPPEDTKNICQVQSDQFFSGVLAAQELYRKGCVRPVILSGASVTHRAMERLRGFREEYGKHQVEISDAQLIYTPNIREVLTESRQAIRYAISQGMNFDGVFAVSDWRALGAYLALTEMGLRVPEDVKLIGYDGVSVASRTLLNITSVQQNIDLIARNACDLLLHSLNAEPIAEKRVVVPTDILPGQTV